MSTKPDRDALFPFTHKGCAVALVVSVSSWLLAFVIGYGLVALWNS